MPHQTAPIPDLRIISTDSPIAHEEHDTQRSEPLIKRLSKATVVTNPPIVAQVEGNHYVILDGANRCYSFAALKIPHILVQVVSYMSGYVHLETWNHVVSRWNSDEFLRHVDQLDNINMRNGQQKDAIAHICLPDNRIVSIHSPVHSVHERNAALRDLVRIYQKNAVLNRTPLIEPEEVWHLYSEANALVIFPSYEPQDIISAALQTAYLPPGISRHIVHGRALQVNYPMDLLKDTTLSLDQKNKELNEWTTNKLINREIRYYSESTYQFSE